MWIGGVRAVVLDEDKRILMVKQRHEGRDIWMVPGGGIEEGENAEQAAVREVKEEAGLDVSVVKLLWHVEEVSENRGQRFVNFFLAEVTGGTLVLGTDPERDENGQVLREIRFMKRDEVENLEILYPGYLRDELWTLIDNNSNGFNSFKIREKCVKRCLIKGENGK